MTRGSGEQLGDALHDILNPPPPHIYFVKQVQEGLEWAGWDRVDFSIGRYIRVNATRDENGQRVRMGMAIGYPEIEYAKYPIHVVQYVLKEFARSLDNWRIDNP